MQGEAASSNGRWGFFFLNRGLRGRNIGGACLLEWQVVFFLLYRRLCGRNVGGAFKQWRIICMQLETSVLQLISSSAAHQQPCRTYRQCLMLWSRG